MAMAVLDHVGIWCHDLDRAADKLSREWGLASAVGGRHEGEGTCNRLIGARGRTYIELIGLDPAQQARGAIARLGETLDDLAPCLAAFRHPDLDQAAAQAAAAGLRTQGPKPMRRAARDGTVLSWRVLFFEDEQQPFFPFLIDWGTALHPSSALDPVAGIGEFAWHCPDAADLNRKLRSIGIAALAVSADRHGLRFTIETPAGTLHVGE
jgi:hypothetical protein